MSAEGKLDLVVLAFIAIALGSQAAIASEGRQAKVASTEDEQAEHKQAVASVEGKWAPAEVMVTQ